jgi:hypothetical protein
MTYTVHCSTENLENRNECKEIDSFKAVPEENDEDFSISNTHFGGCQGM